MQGMKPARLEISYKPATGRAVRISRTGTANALLDALLAISKRIVADHRETTPKRKRRAR